MKLDMSPCTMCVSLRYVSANFTRYSQIDLHSVHTKLHVSAVYRSSHFPVLVPSLGLGLCNEKSAILFWNLTKGFKFHLGLKQATITS